jgi:hypothetical protein
LAGFFFWIGGSGEIGSGAQEHRGRGQSQTGSHWEILH